MTRSSSPRSWGCFRSSVPSGMALLVFPTLVGVFPNGWAWPWPRWRLPHARGGVSVTPSSTLPGHLSSPRSWGCFTGDAQPQQGLPVFPTLVGVFPRRTPRPDPRSGLPHARGGVSKTVSCMGDYPFEVGATPCPVSLFKRDKR